MPYTHQIMEYPKPNFTLKFMNSDNEEVATLDFNGPGLAFEGIADEAANAQTTFILAHHHSAHG